MRFAYMVEFLVALPAITLLWSHSGGQVHLDLMPWYAKLVLTVALALVTVLGTKASMDNRRAWNGKSITCLVVAILIAAGMGVLTYYYHLHEAEEDEEEDGGTVAVMMVPALILHGKQLA